ncbi:elongator complex 6 [Pyrenophora seminiperda CCB06]|uniref:Elongator complex 6 n=1 Tax=Pyrenophora seminiperda CCB06 TaxID=1302712 RepID=A0A3M7MD40_9PLEO|nr:elongator complex 6 [Pyrenophora seminiperda CCB06]
MPPSNRIPPLLQPYVQLPYDESLLLLTSTLGASANWLLIRFLCNELSSSNTQDGGDDGRNVILVSWMREHDFWKQEARKSAGLDMERLRREGRFAFVDGLGAGAGATDEGAISSEARSDAQAQPPVAVSNALPAQRAPQILPARGPPGRIVPARGPPVSAPAAAPKTSHESTGAKKPTPGHYTLKTLELADVKATVCAAISSLATSAASRKTLLIFDNPDLLLALNPTISPFQFTSLLLELHTLPTISHILTHMQADNPLLSLSTPPQPLEVTHHNLLVKCAHMSRRILGVRVLDTGVARDVSGVVRITEQRRHFLRAAQRKESDDDGGRGKEFLYQVKGDGSVRVFERGAGGEG